ncbi:hypothetical protein [Pseudomonas quasicaspiana]|uniref:hypothetical protein n=1 Tax=Pseudomonas quasicaspiana TaxID=2829821 RepID=UPI001E45AAF3|nr:hypothetical protein [Pseudomonas quasicaspiana]
MTVLVNKDIKAPLPFTACSAVNKGAAIQGNTVSTPFGKVLEAQINCYKPDRRPEGRVLSNLEIREDIMKEARLSPGDASRLAHSYTFNSLTMSLNDVTDRDNIRYSGNGELITAESTAYFTKTMQAAQRERAEIYRSEMEKGTPPVSILEKILRFNDSLPPRFLDMCAW